MISKSALVVERMLRFMKMKANIDRFEDKFLRNERYAKPPKLILKSYDVDEVIIDGRKCYTLNAEKMSDTHILFFHGGAYTAQAIVLHWMFILNIIIELGCAVTFVDYPLAPESTCDDTISMVMHAYEHFSKNHTNKMILMGDSAGGGLALAMAQILRNKNFYRRPDKIVMISPWLDISMTTEIPEYMLEEDLMLSVEKLTMDGKRYAGKIDTKDPLCSPMYGDSYDVGDMAIFIGTKDILSVAAEKFKEKAVKNGWSLELYEYEGMQHDFVIMPIDEAKTALIDIAEFIRK